MSFAPGHGPPRTQSFSGQTPVRLDGNPNGPLAAIGAWRGVKDFEHGTLCRVFGLDPATYYFDLPSSVRGTGSRSSGYGGGQRAGQRLINGYVMQGGMNEPVAKLTIVNEADRFKDVDPTSTRDFLDLSHS